VLVIVAPAKPEPPPAPTQPGDQLELPGLEKPTPRDHLDAMRDHLAECQKRSA
jgi:hypothetical protein